MSEVSIHISATAEMKSVQGILRDEAVKAVSIHISATAEMKFSNQVVPRIEQVSIHISATAEMK